MAESRIEWTEMTWNPTTGCNKISAGCKYCYAEVMTRRLQAMGIETYKDYFPIRTHFFLFAIDFPQFFKFHCHNANKILF